MTYKPEKSGEFGAKLKQLLAERSLSDRAFAKQSGLDTTYLSKLLNGKIAEPRRPTLEKLVQGLGLRSVDQLYAEMQRLNLPDQKLPDQKPGFLPGLPETDAGLDRTPVSQDAQLEQLVRDVRSRLHPIFTDPNNNIGTLGVLGVNRPVLVDQQIYIDLNLLEQVSCEWYFSQWQQVYEVGDRHLFDRLGVGQVKQPRVDAIATVLEYPKLLVLGKPGSGKTTFLKALAVKCIQPNSDLFADLVPLLVTLREFAQAARKTDSWNLVDYLVILASRQGWGGEDIHDVLAQGRALWLLDGLDEVPSEDLQLVLDAVQALQYHQNHLVITCRTQRHGVVLER